MRSLTLRHHVLAALILLPLVSALAEPSWTKRHEEGRCAIRGNCGKQGFLGSELPCPDNGLAEDPDEDVREKLTSICGDAWSEGPVCCREKQLDALRSNLKRVKPLISSCPACKANFFNLFCTFTCSPDQSLFINVTKVQKKGDKFLVTELDHLVSDEYGSGFYDSCKDVKFGATNSRAMDFIGGGAKNYTQFLAFLGRKSALGSPFQINFPRPDLGDFPDMRPMNDTARPCNDTDEKYRCACVDCASSCPELPAVKEAQSCRVGALPCLSFAVILSYSVCLLLLVIAVSGHVAYQKHTKGKNERLRLLQDAYLSDDEDEGDVVLSAGILEEPRRRYWLNTWCDLAFSRLGRLCATFPAITISISAFFVILLSLGWLRFAVETDPVRLWVSPDSAAAEEKTFYDSNFGPFFRAEQAFLVNDTDPSGPGPVLSYDTLRWWFDVEDRVQRLKSSHGGVTFDQICYKPTGDACVVQSITGYFGGSFASVDKDTWAEDLKACAANPADCLPDFQQPLQPKYILGKYNRSVADAEAIIVTWLVNNHAEGTIELQRAMDWEKSLQSLLRDVQTEAKNRGLRLSYNTEISLEQELNKSTNTDAKIVVISYVIMFLYASLALGSTTLAAKSFLHNPASALVQSKFMLGVVGILIVLMSVSASVGLFSALGVKATLIIAEVIPFLVLAVGVDNIFLIVHEFERVNATHSEKTVPERVAKALGRMGPSILLSASTETVAFALGAFVGMPAVRNFAAYAAGAVFINAILQVTMFVSVLALNQRRVEDSRMDCFPFIKIKRADLGAANGVTAYGHEEEGALQRFIRKTYAPALLGKKAKVVIVTAFLGLFTAGLALIPGVQLGLDQRIAIPNDSYLIPYFNDLYDYFEAGPPVYFVTRETNFTARHYQQEVCGRFSTCKDFSLANILEQERKRPEVSYIADATANWLDDFFQWLNPSLEECCVDRSQPCFADRNPPWNTTLYGMPEGTEFIHYLSRWVAAPTTPECPVAGKAAYGDALVIASDALTIPASHFRTSHTPLRSQSDFISAYTSARRIAAAITARTGVPYTTIVQLTATLLGAALGIIFVLTAVLLGSARTALVVTATVAMIVVDVLGAMAVAGVSLNAVSLVNLVICVGIGVEFCAHIARAFTYPSPSLLERARSAGFVSGASLASSGGGGGSGFRAKDARAWAALVSVGGAVFSGITVTKLLGVCVLAFTRSKIFEIYYFRVWVALVLFAALHALVWLPVALSLGGGRGYVDPESSGDGGLEEDLARRRQRALVPDDDEGYDSD